MDSSHARTKDYTCYDPLSINLPWLLFARLQRFQKLIDKYSPELNKLLQRWIDLCTHLFSSYDQVARAPYAFDCTCAHDYKFLIGLYVLQIDEALYELEKTFGNLKLQAVWRTDFHQELHLVPKSRAREFIYVIGYQVGDIVTSRFC